ncbi:hypothetical protein AGMMS50256_36770 [Betaproteobacteria bacterium]|nr:hypothetical protein AGMMS50256_36770 [Betaproteobacteria bacterium]
MVLISVCCQEVNIRMVRKSVLARPIIIFQTAITELKAVVVY